MTDLAGIKPSELDFEILHPATKENLGVRVSICSLDDDRLSKLKRAITDQRLHLEARSKSFKAEQLEENLHNLIFTAMTGWIWYNPTGDEKTKGYDAEAMPNFRGAIPDFNRKNVYDVLRELPWFADQINEVFSDTKAFFTRFKSN